MNDKFLKELGELQEQSEVELDHKMDQWWASLSKEDQRKAFYSVIKRATKAESEGSSYRHVLYDVFEFPPSSYHLGMLCGYMALHNMINQ